MGGNVLKEHGARRLTEAKAKEVSAKVCAAIDEIFLEHGYKFLQAGNNTTGLGWFERKFRT